MAGVNKVIIVGRLGNDPEMRTMPNGDAVANISVATSEAWTDRNTNERREITEWHRIVFFRRQAEVAGEYLRKGSQVYVEGKLRTRKWQDQNGQDRYSTEIIGDVLQMLGGRDSAQSGYNNAPAGSGYNNNSNDFGGNYGGNYGGNSYPTNSAPKSTPKPASTPAPAPADLDDGFNDDNIPF